MSEIAKAHTLGLQSKASRLFPSMLKTTPQAKARGCVFDIAEYAMGRLLKLGAEYVEVRLVTTKGSSYTFKNGVLLAGGIEDSFGVCARFLVNGCLGFTSTNLLTKGDIRKVIEKSYKLTKSARKFGETVKLSEEDVYKQEYTVKQKIKIDNVSIESKVRLLHDIDKNILRSKVSVPGRFLSLSDSITTEYLATSEGSMIHAIIPRVNFYYFLTLSGKRSIQRYWQYGQTGGWECVESWRLPETLGNEVELLSKNAEQGIKAPQKILDVVCGPQITGIMAHESVGHPYEADRILGREAAQAGESFVTVDMIGTRIGNKAVNVADDPTIANSYGFYLYDSEGVKARRKLLIKEGMINEFLHNRQTATSLRLKSNGSARASQYDKESIVRMSNTYFVPGEYNEEELFEDILEGIYLKSFTEWNIDDKRYNQKYVGAEAYLIKNGKISKPVFQPVLEINTKKLWNSVDAAANNLEHHAGSCGKGEPMQAIPTWLGGPSIRLRKVMVR